MSSTKQMCALRYFKKDVFHFCTKTYIEDKLSADVFLSRFSCGQIHNYSQNFIIKYTDLFISRIFDFGVLCCIYLAAGFINELMKWKVNYKNYTKSISLCLQNSRDYGAATKWKFCVLKRRSNGRKGGCWHFMRVYFSTFKSATNFMVASRFGISLGTCFCSLNNFWKKVNLQK